MKEKYAFIISILIVSIIKFIYNYITFVNEDFSASLTYPILTLIEGKKAVFAVEYNPDIYKNIEMNSSQSLQPI